jgi:hypothetical protein
MEDARKIEEQRKAQAQAAINLAARYRATESTNAEAKKKLMEEAGTESGNAAGLRGEAGADRLAAQAQAATDAHVASLHQASANLVAGASSQTTAAVEHFTATTVAGFQDVHDKFLSHQRQLDAIRQRMSQIETTH